MEYLTKVTSKGQVTIPKAVRDQYGIDEGDYLILDSREDELVIRKGRMIAENSPAHQDFDSLADSIAAHFEEQGITRADVDDAIRWARKR